MATAVTAAPGRGRPKLILFDPDGRLAVPAAEVRPVHLPDRPVHVVRRFKLHDAERAVPGALDIGVQRRGNLPEVVLQVLPRCALRDSAHGDPEPGGIGRRAPAASPVVKPVPPLRPTAGHLDAQPGTHEVPAVPGAHGILGVPVVSELDEAKIRRARRHLDLQGDDPPELLEILAEVPERWCGAVESESGRCRRSSRRQARSRRQAVADEATCQISLPSRRRRTWGPPTEQQSNVRWSSQSYLDSGRYMPPAARREQPQPGQSVEDSKAALHSMARSSRPGRTSLSHRRSGCPRRPTSHLLLPVWTRAP